MASSPAHIGDLIAQLKQAFPREKVGIETLTVYVRELQDLDPGVLEHAVRELIRTSEFFPTVRAIRAAAVERSLGVPTEAQALAQIDARLRDAGSAPEQHPLVEEALRIVGGLRAFRTADQPAILRGQFGRIYRDLRAETMREAQVGTIALQQGDTAKAICR